MLPIFSIIDGDIKYNPNPSSSNLQDYPWELRLEEVCICAIWDRFVWEDDLRFLILVDTKGTIYPINLAGSLNEDNENLRTFLELKKVIIPVYKFDKATVIFPEDLQTLRLYEYDFWVALKRFFHAAHPAMGKLSVVIRNYLAFRKRSN